MTMLLTRGARTWDVSKLYTDATWSGDKASISRQMSCSIAYTVELGDILTLLEGEQRLFVGVVLRRELGSEDLTTTVTAFDYGYYLQRNDGTYKFTGATPEAITRRVCTDRDIPVAQLPTTGARIDRKFAGVALNQIVTTAWSLAREKTGDEYAIRYTPEGLLVKRRTMGTDGLMLAAGANLMDAKTVEDASRMVNSVAIYDSNGNFLRRSGDATAQALYGVMEAHLTQSKGKSADADDRARSTLEDGRLARTVTVNVLGNSAYLAGETVMVREPGTGLIGVFWIDGDVHTWKNNAHYTRLTLNCRNVMGTAKVGSVME